MAKRFDEHWDRFAEFVAPRRRRYGLEPNVSTDESNTCACLSPGRVVPEVRRVPRARGRRDPTCLGRKQLAWRLARGRAATRGGESSWSRATAERASAGDLTGVAVFRRVAEFRPPPGYWE
jgi:hypothetical protein